MFRTFIVVLILSLFALGLMLEMSPKKEVLQSNPKSNAKPIASASPSNSHAKSTPQVRTSTQEEVAREALKVGLTDPHPDVTLATLKARAAALTDSEMKDLFEISQNTELPTDQRFYAVFLLAHNSTNDALLHLESISQLPLEDVRNDRDYSDELIIRMQALEALVQSLPVNQAKTFLQRYLIRQSDPQLAKHARYLLTKS